MPDAPGRSSLASSTRQRRPTLLDVARLANVSSATVSRVVNGRLGVDDATRAAVEAAIAQLGYRPSRIGRALASKKTNTVALIISDITNPFFSEIAQAVEDGAVARNYVALVSSVSEAIPSTRAAAYTLLDHGIDGLMIAAARPSDSYLAELQAQGIPVVVINRRADPFADPYIGTDCCAGGELVVRHLAQLGHTRIAHVAGPSAIAPNEQRVRGYFAGIAAAGLDYARIVHVPDHSPDAGRAAGAELLHDRTPPTAIFAVNDYCALGVIDAVEQAGLSVPDDVAVVGYDDTWIASLPGIQLTSVTSWMREMAETGVNLLLDLIEHNELYAPSVVKPPELRVRRTCGAQAPRITTRPTGSADR
jgi:DNA-binding LacI/PurR family transcriptional regulator